MAIDDSRKRMNVWIWLTRFEWELALELEKQKTIVYKIQTNKKLQIDDDEKFYATAIN